MANINPMVIFGGALCLVGTVWLVIGLSNPTLYASKAREVALQPGYHVTVNGHCWSNNSDHTIYVTPMGDGISVAVRDPDAQSPGPHMSVN